MAQRKLLNLALLVMMIASLFLGGSQVQAQPPNPPTGNPKMDLQAALQAAMDQQQKNGKPNGQMRALTVTERQAARLKQPAQPKGVSANYAGVNQATAAYSALAPAATLATMAGPFSTPDYFGVANWAISPMPTIQVVNTVIPVPIGHPLIQRANATDVTANVLVVNTRAPLVAGTLSQVQTWNEPGSGPNTFHALILRPTATPGQYAVVYDSGPLAVPAVATATEQSFTVPPFAVQAGDLLAHYGQGVPMDTGAGADTTFSPAIGLPALNTIIAVNIAPIGPYRQYLPTISAGGTGPGAPAGPYPLYSTDRTYSIHFVVDVSGVTGQLVGGMRKFVDTLPGICGLPGETNDLGQCIPLAVPDTTTFPGSDYYEISLVQYREQLHADLPAVAGLSKTDPAATGGTLLRGYVQTNNGTDPVTGLNTVAPAGVHYLGPLIIAHGCEAHSASGATCAPRPVRVKFTNRLPTGQAGDLFIPTDTTYMGAGMGPQGVIARIDVGNGGSGYTSVPDVTIAAPGTGGVQATAVATVAGGIVTGIRVTNAGAGYEAGSSPAVTIADPPAGGVKATAVAVVPVAGEMYAQDRATLHLHGGNTPWISDGTAHQWVAPVGENTSYEDGLSQRDVPDMWFDAAGNLLPATSNCQGSTTCGVAGATNDPGQGKGTFYWTNQQGGRLMFFHDHAYGVTRLNVYVGEAAGYLLADPNAETQLKAATVPGTITDPAHPTNTAANDVTHLYPLIIQDKTFVPDNGEAGGQLAATDPTWPSPANPLPGSTGWGKGNLWFPHVYTPNQNPADITGANAYGRWDYGPWFWPPQNPSTFVESGQPFQCTSAAYATTPPARPPLMCPGTPNPSGVPEGFMDTPLINGTAYPSLTVDPAAYRFQVLSAGNDRTLNLGLYVADPLAVAVLDGGSGYSPDSPPAVAFSPNPGGATATTQVSTGQVTSVLVTGTGAGYFGPATPTVTIAPPTCTPFPSATCIQATASAVINPIVGQLTAINVQNSGAGYTTVPSVTVQPSTALGCTIGCTQATAQAQMTAAGTVVSITVTNPGSDWTQTPAVVIAPPAAGGSQATAIAAVNSEVKMVDALPRTASSTMPLCTTATATGGAMLSIASLDASGNPLNGTGYQAGCWPTTWPVDGRDGGVPDPSTVGPPIIQIGTEGGLLPSPVVIPSTPIGYEYNRRSITVLNVFNHGLMLGPAERADIVVDFSKYAGKTLIVYNDAPAPVPAFDPRNDYYTGDADQTLSGGAPSTMPGHGPNTRTIMQIKVNATATNPNSTAFSLPALTAALPGIFASAQDRIIAPEPAYPAGNGGAATTTYVAIQDTTVSTWLNGAPVGVTLLTGGAGYTRVPNVTIAAPAGCTPPAVCATATATAALRPTSVASVALVSPNNGGAGYDGPPAAPPAVTISGGGGIGATGAAVLATTGSLKSVTIGSGGSGYASAPTVTFDPPTGCVLNTPGCVQATGTAILAADTVASISLTDPGAGYTAAPAITWSGGGGGTGAAATAAVGYAVASVTLAPGGSGYTAPPSVSIAAPTGCTSGGLCVQANAAATLTPTFVRSLTLTSGGNGYTAAPAVTIDPPDCTPNPTNTCNTATAIAFAATPLLPKAIQELFTLDYGRMNATLGVELPFTNFNTQTTIPYGYVDPPTEIFKDGDTQFWKISHNGVDTHFIHFHLFNVQVINRVGWDGMIKPPDPNELSWKDTVRMNPLEDIIVALRPLHQTLPWDLPNSVRPLDVTEPVGTSTANEFTGINPANQPAAVVNDLTNFGWEYVWHCHILGHEENDMMRPMAFAVPPKAPTNVSAPAGGGSVSWTDASLNETGFTIQIGSSATGPWTVLGTVPAAQGSGNLLTFTSDQITTGMYVLVIANNLVGYTRAYTAPVVGYPTMSADTAATAVLVP